MIKRAQISLEMVLALILSVILLIGATKIFVWLNQCLIERQERYKATRITAGTPGATDQTINFYQPSTLNLWGD